MSGALLSKTFDKPEHIFGNKDICVNFRYAGSFGESLKAHDCGCAESTQQIEGAVV